VGSGRAVRLSELQSLPSPTECQRRRHYRLTTRPYCNEVNELGTKGSITSKIKHAIKLKASPARLAQLLQPSLAFCFSLQPMTAHRPVAVIGCKLKQNANEVCNSCASLAGLVLSFIVCFILLVIALCQLANLSSNTVEQTTWSTMTSSRL